MRDVVIVGMARTPFGSFQGTLSTVQASKLGGIAIKAAVKNAGIKPEQVSEVIMGSVLQGGQGQAPARQALIAAGLPVSIPALTINKVCGSGMKAIMLGMQSIMLGDSEIVVAGGMENMSLAPYFIPGARSGLRMGNQTCVDGMVNDGLWDPYRNQHMGNFGDLCAREKSYSREDQDKLAVDSFKHALDAQKSGKLSKMIAPVEIAGKKGEVTVVDTDEGPAKVKFDKIPTLKPAFDKNGSVTAANASSINDGAAAVVLMSADKASTLGLKPIAKIVSYATHAQEPEWFTTAPAHAMRVALKKASWTIKNVDLFEVNEAFAVVTLDAQRELEIPSDKMNVWGGAIAIGHPIGASGARIIMTLAAALKDRGLKRGMAGICIGGGEATAMCIETM